MSKQKSYPRSTLPAELHDFRNFLYVVWNAIGLPDPTPLQYEVAQWLQFGPDRSITCALRGLGKSFVAVTYGMWCLGMDPTINVLIVSASKEKADDNVQFAYRLLELEILEHLKPRKELGERSRATSFDVRGADISQAPSLRSKGITGQITGSRADVIIPDDIEVPTNSWTQTMRDKLAHMVTEFEAVIKPDPTGTWGRIAYLGTPHTAESLYWHLTEQGYGMRMWPAQYPEDIAIYRGFLAPGIAGRLLDDPGLAGEATDTRFPLHDLQERRASMGNTAYQMQFMLNSDLSDEQRYPLKLKDCILMDVDDAAAPERVIYAGTLDYHDGEVPNMGFRSDRWQKPMSIMGSWEKFEEILMAVDPSGRGKDECAYVVVARLAGQLYLLDWGGFLDGYDEQTLTRLASIAARYKVGRIIAEGNFGDGMWGRLFGPYILRSGHQAHFEEVTVHGRKEDRILDILEPLFQQHRFVVNRSRVLSEIEELQARDDGATGGTYNLFSQATHICREPGALKHDDRLDALATAALHIGESLSLSPNQEFAQRKNEAYEASIQEFMDGWDEQHGRPIQEETWLEL